MTRLCDNERKRFFRLASTQKCNFRLSLLFVGILWILSAIDLALNLFVTANGDDTVNHRLTIPLDDGNSMPYIGLGVALTGDQTYEAVRHAIKLGYSLIDTAAEESYGNEDQVGKAVGDSNDKVFITTKLWDSDHGFYATLKAFQKSHQQINKYTGDNKIPIDLYLMHSPFGGRLLETWDALVWLQQHGHIQSIGVSNFGIEHLEVLRLNGRPMPVVNQIEMHPLVYHQRQGLLRYCQEHNIVVQAFGSLMHGYSQFLVYPPEILSNMVEYYKTNGIQYAVYHRDESDDNESVNNDITVAHILLQWAVQHKFAIIPKSSKTKRITENVRFLKLAETESSDFVDFVLSEKDMILLDEWGEHLPYEHRNIYKEDWNWNPIDEAPVHVGMDGYWPKYERLEGKNLEQILEEYQDSNAEEDEYWHEYWQDGIYLNDDDGVEKYEEEDDDYYDGEFLSEL